MKIYYEKDADISLIQTKKVGIIGYGSQGHAHALNLRDSGVSVRVGLAPSSRSRSQVRQDGLQAGDVNKVAAWADVIMLLVPDTVQPQVYQADIAPHLSPSKTLMFAHGFNIHFGTIDPPEGIDVSMIAPKAPGHRLRETYVSGEGVPALVAVARDASGQALDTALSYAYALGVARAGVLTTSFKEETETDLFGEQAVLCGGVSALVQAGFETLVEAGYQPEVAYFECLHELKLIVDLMYRGGLNYMRYSVSDTAEYGDYTAGHKLINDETRARMKELLEAVQDGSFARQWIEQCEKGQPDFKQLRELHRRHPLEETGKKLRRQMTFLDPVEVTDDGTLKHSAESPQADIDVAARMF